MSETVLGPKSTLPTVLKWLSEVVEAAKNLGLQATSQGSPRTEAGRTLQLPGQIPGKAGNGEGKDVNSKQNLLSSLPQMAAFTVM